MFNTFGVKALQTKLAITGFIAGAYGRVADRRETGQGAVEYVGIVLVAAAIVGALIIWGPQLANIIKAKITTAVSGL